VLVIANKIVAFEKKRDSESFINGVAIHFVRTDAQQEQINATIKKSVVCEKYQTVGSTENVDEFG